MPVDASPYSLLHQPAGIGQMDPAGVVGLVQGMNNVEQFNANRLTGQAYQQSTDQNGVTDPNGAMNLLRQDPRAAIAMPQAAASATSLAQSQFNLAQNRTQFLRDSFGSLINKKDLSKHDINNAIASMAKNIGPEQAAAYSQQLDEIPDQPDALRKWAQAQGATALGTSGMQGRIQGPPGPGGQVNMVPAGAAVFDQGQSPGGAIPGQMSVTQPTGQPEVQQAAAQASIALHQQVADPNIRSTLQNLHDAMQEAASGPTAQVEARASALAQRFKDLTGFGPDFTLDRDQLADTEKAQKLIADLSRRTVLGGHASEEFLHNANAANPSLLQSKLGRGTMASSLLGDFDAAKVRDEEFAKLDPSGANAHNFWNWNREFNKTFDPRAFQMAAMSPDEARAFRSVMPPQERTKVAQSTYDYYLKGWIPPPAGLRVGRNADGTPGLYHAEPGPDGKYLRVPPPPGAQ